MVVEFLAVYREALSTLVRSLSGFSRAHSISTYIKVVIALRSHPFPFRTGSLSSASPMVLHCVVGE